MHPQLDAALGRLDDARRDLQAAATAVSPQRQGRKPAADRWSINEVLEHIGLVEQLFLKSLIGSIDAAKSSGTEAEVDVPPMLSEDLRAVVEDRTTRRNAPEHVQPTGTVDAPTALQMIEAGHRELRRALDAAQDVALSRVTYAHRVFGALNIYQWVDFLAGHERRHLAQLREVAGEVSAV